MLSQFDSQWWVNLTLNVELICFSMLSQFDSQCWVNLTLNVESIWLSMLSQFDSQCWVNLTLNVESIWLPTCILYTFNALFLCIKTLYIPYSQPLLHCDVSIKNMIYFSFYTIIPSFYLKLLILATKYVHTFLLNVNRVAYFILIQISNIL